MQLWDLTYSACLAAYIFNSEVWHNSSTHYDFSSFIHQVRLTFTHPMKHSILTTVWLKTSKWSFREAQWLPLMWNKDMNKRPNVQQIKNTYPTVSLECPCKYPSQSLQPPHTTRLAHNPPAPIYEPYLSRINTYDPWSLQLALAAFLNYGNIFSDCCDGHRGSHGCDYGDCCRLEYETV
jgi:hypothetical protein